MATPIVFRSVTIPLIHRSTAIPVVDFGMPIPDPLVTKQTADAAPEMGLRYLDCVERASNEVAIGDVMQAAWRAARPSCSSVSHQALPDDFRHRAEEDTAGASAPTR